MPGKPMHSPCEYYQVGMERFLHPALITGTSAGHGCRQTEVRPTMKTWRLSQKLIVVLTLTYAAVFVGMLILRPGSKQFYYAFFNTYQILPPLFAGITGLVCFRLGFHPNPVRRIGWFVIALACLSFAAGQSTWTYFESIRGIEVPFPSWADAGYLGVYPLLIVGVLLLFGSMPIAGRARQLLDSAIAASSVGTLSWYFIIQRQWHQSDISLVGKVISISYPLGDVAALFGAVILLSTVGANRLLRRTLYFLASGVVLFTIFDTSFTYMSLNGTYETGSWSDWTVSFGWILIGYSFLTRIWWRHDAQASDGVVNSSGVQVRSMRQILMPYVAVLVACSTIGIHDYAQKGHIAQSSIFAGMYLVFLVILRQILTLTENQSLTSKLKAFSDNLERLVAQRTEQLTALHNLTKAVNTTMKPDEVLAAAVTHTKAALRADATVVWLVNQPAEALQGTSAASVKLHDGFEAKPEMFEFLAGQPVREQVDAISLVTSPHSHECSTGWCLRAPLRWQQTVIGMIGVVRWDAEFGITESQLLESIGLEVGTALENARLYSAAVEAADIDSVTGLFNHRAIHQRLDRALSEAKKHDKPMSIIMMDMDNFKLFNDTYGHPIGDQVLKRVGKALRDACRARDILGRYGGDEFIVVLPETTPEDALEIAQEIREKTDLAGFRRPHEDRIVPITLSFGIAGFPSDGTNRHELLMIADSNLYAAKESDERIAATTEAQRVNRKMWGEGSFAILDALVTAVDNKDRYTRRHAEDVTEYATWIAEEMGLSEETMRQIRIGGLLHDVGKITVPDEILRKPGRLTPEEREIVQRHSWMGALIVSAVAGMEGAIDAVRSHHERWDGEGYSNQLAGEEIPLISRIMAVADSFSAMTTDRAYRRGLSWEEAVAEVRANKGTQFDPAVVEAFLRAAQKRRGTRTTDEDSDETAQPFAA